VAFRAAPRGHLGIEMEKSLARNEKQQKSGRLQLGGCLIQTDGHLHNGNNCVTDADADHKLNGIDPMACKGLAFQGHLPSKNKRNLGRSLPFTT